MNRKIYRTAQGKSIDVDMLRLQNEETIAVGNMKVNARGDELGPGGTVVRTRNEVMQDHYQSNAVYTEESVAARDREIAQMQRQPEVDDVADLDPEIAEQDAEMPVGKKLRGSLADAVAKTATVEQKVLTPKKSGPSRI
jgi:hypothetical protein